MLMNKHRVGVGAKQDGFAALVIAIVLVLVLSLITIGFAQLMRSEQRSSLDRQLSSEAYYAAESGINDANRALQGGYSLAKTKCDNGPSSVDYAQPGSSYLKNSDVNSATTSKYTCLLINPHPSDLQYSSIPVNEATSAIVSGSDNSGLDAKIGKLVFSWQDENGGQVFTPAGWYSNGGNSRFPPVAGWTNGGAITGALRISITPLGNSKTGTLVNLDRASLINNTFTAFLYPEGAGSSTPITGLTATSMDNNSGVNSGLVLSGSCNAMNKPRYCSVAVDMGSYSGYDYVIHLSSIYRTTSVTITPYSPPPFNAKMYVKGAQTVVDSTGKVQDVLKRIQVRLPARNGFDYPEFDVQTVNGICKQLSSYPPNISTGTAGYAGNACGSL